MTHEQRYRMATRLRELAAEIDRNVTAHDPHIQIETSASYYPYVGDSVHIVREPDPERVREHWTIKVSFVKRVVRPLPPAVIDRDLGDEDRCAP